MNNRLNIFAHVPSHFRQNVTTGGTYRDAVRLFATAGATMVETKGRIGSVLSQDVSIHNEKGARRLSARLHKSLGDRLLFTQLSCGLRRQRMFSVHFMAAELDPLFICDCEVRAEPGDFEEWTYEMARSHQPTRSRALCRALREG